ncbi:LicD family protein [Pseudoxanthomonas suwonensis]|uniref:LicD/FKTN/FKRP nucleotidyltransferase domain-containing protein n=1 Tax=Pseudoxanthomonas suwonensis TaxID=314722 RepID=A0A0E3UNB1_9GAMM|nr:LicD family protein [Pseudoxanthomonas suwonensis]AKC86800.1 hypothetical protein WQ53_08560 [Pseudoxanthomonas suwonensis]
MQNIIHTDFGDYLFSAVHLYHGRGAIDPEISARNLLLLKELLDNRDIRFGIIYGTLLGAIREGGFIPWDEDVDIYILNEYKKDFQNYLHELREHGLEIVRADGDLYSLMKDNNYIDIYFFRRNGGRRICNRDSVRSAYIENHEPLNFLGTTFLAPSNARQFLSEVYGPDWMTPKRDFPAKPWSNWMKFKEAVKVKFPFLLQAKQWLRR